MMSSVEMMSELRTKFNEMVANMSTLRAQSAQNDARLQSILNQMLHQEGDIEEYRPPKYNLDGMENIVAKLHQILVTATSVGDQQHKSMGAIFQRSHDAQEEIISRMNTLRAEITERGNPELQAIRLEAIQKELKRLQEARDDAIREHQEIVAKTGMVHRRHSDTICDDMYKKTMDKLAKTDQLLAQKMVDMAIIQDMLQTEQMMLSITKEKLLHYNSSKSMENRLNIRTK